MLSARTDSPVRSLVLCEHAAVGGRLVHAALVSSGNSSVSIDSNATGAVPNSQFVGDAHPGAPAEPAPDHVYDVAAAALDVPASAAQPTMPTRNPYTRLIPALSRSPW